MYQPGGFIGLALLLPIKPLFQSLCYLFPLQTNSFTAGCSETFSGIAVQNICTSSLNGIVFSLPTELREQRNLNDK